MYQEMSFDEQSFVHRTEQATTSVNSLSSDFWALLRGGIGMTEVVMILKQCTARHPQVADWHSGFSAENDELGLSIPTQWRQAGTSFRPWATESIARHTAITTQPTPADPHQEQRDRLDGVLLSYVSLEVGWDGFEGVPASDAAVADAMQFIELLPPTIPLPYPQLAPDGEVGLYWRSGQIFVEIGFNGDGEYWYYAKAPSALEQQLDESWADDRPISTKLPDELIRMLSKLK